MTCSLLIPESVESAVRKTLNRLAKKAGVELTDVPGTTCLCRPGREREPIPCVRITVGTMPRVDGWQLVARIEHTDVGNIVNCAPGESLPVDWRKAANHCDHCNAARQRINTFVLRSPDGQLVQIGKNCLKDFLQIDPSKLVGQAELAAWQRLFEGQGWSDWCPSGGKPDAWTREFVACAVRSIRRSGFRKSDSMAPTKEAAWFCCMPLSVHADRETREDYLQGQPAEEDYTDADAAIAWARGLLDQPGRVSDYEHNLHIVAQQYFVGKNAGLLASLPVAHQRAMGQAAAKPAAPSPAKTSGHFGVVGKRIDFEATFVGRTDIETNWGSKHICRFQTDDGHALVWFATSRAPVREGTRLKIRATIKEHGEYNGKPQTVLSRCDWTEPTRMQDDVFLVAFQTWLWKEAPGPWLDEASLACYGLHCTIQEARARFMVRGDLEQRSA